MNTEKRDHIIEKFGNRLRIRVSGISIIDHKILLVKHQNIGEKPVLWSPPGGGMEFGENAHQALKREFKEESNLEIDVNQLLFVNEYLQKPLHAIELFFEVTIKSGTLSKGFDPELNPQNQIIEDIQYIDIDTIKSQPEEYHSIFKSIDKLDQLFTLKNYHLDGKSNY